MASSRSREESSGKAQLWVVATGQPRGPSVQFASEVFTAAFSPDAKTVLVRTSTAPRGFATRSPASTRGLPLQVGKGVFACMFSPDGAIAAYRQPRRHRPPLERGHR